jgi:hypothetical protein
MCFRGGGKIIWPSGTGTPERTTVDDDVDVVIESTRNV